MTCKSTTNTHLQSFVSDQMEASICTAYGKGIVGPFNTVLPPVANLLDANSVGPKKASTPKHQ